MEKSIKVKYIGKRKYLSATIDDKKYLFTWEELYKGYYREKGIVDGDENGKQILKVEESLPRCTHPCCEKHPKNPVCPLAINEELAKRYFPILCQSQDSLEDDPDQIPCEWYEED